MASGGSLDELVAAAGVAPGLGLQVADAAHVGALPVDPALPLLLLSSSGTPEPAALAGRHARTGALEIIRRLYPPTHEVRDLVAGSWHRLEELDDARLGTTSWLLPALDPIDNLASPHCLPWISRRLRAPDGCPWDRRQDHGSLRRFLLEEAYEALDAIERGTPADLAEELGDLLLQVILHAQLAAESGAFDLTDVYRAIGTKIVRRHPHVFGGLEVSGVEQVLSNWESIKAAERAEIATPAEPGSGGTFDRLVRAQPALAGSRELQERASAAGWDWPAIDGVWDKLAEELDELREADGLDARRHELGDVLFALVNLGRWLEVDPEDALRHANRRWIDRYHTVERLATERGTVLAELDPAAKDRLWEEAKLAGTSGGR